MSNIVKFPITNPRAPLIEDVQQTISTAKLFHVEEALEVLIPVMFGQFDLLGFSISYEDNEKDYQLIVEAIRSMLYKHYDLTYPLQDMVEKLMVKDEDGDLIFNENFKYSLKRKKKEPKEKTSQVE